MREPVGKEATPGLDSAVERPPDLPGVSQEGWWPAEHWPRSLAG